MGLLEGKNALIFGVANKNSIAWGITEAFHAEGAQIGLSYAGEVLKKRVMPLAESIGVTFVEECDVQDDAALDRVFAAAQARFGKIDILVHAVAFAAREDLEGEFIKTTRQNWNTSLSISAYSLVAMAQRVRPMMPEGGSIITLTYYGSEKVMPNYNIMGVSKAALEASVRYLSYDLGASKIRVNAISPGPIKTLSASGIAGFRDMLRFSESASPLQELVTPEDVGKTALWLCSDWGKMVTGQTIYVDAGYSVMGLPLGALKATSGDAS
ncbi:MAG: enoyl-ACP reductase FabI [Anaerolineae bacterium]